MSGVKLTFSEGSSGDHPGSPGTTLGPPWAIRGPSWMSLGPSRCHPGTILASLGPSWGHPGTTWAPSRCHLGPPEAIWASSWVPSGPLDREKPTKTNGFSIFKGTIWGSSCPSWGCFGATLGYDRAISGTSWGHPGHPGTTLGRPWGLLEATLGPSGVSWG